MRVMSPKELACMVLCTCSAMVSAAEVECVPQRHVDVASISAPVVMVGEPHGTNEFPEFTRGLVCSLLKAGKSVILGIEHDGDEQAGLNKYLLSKGTAADQVDLLRAPAWQRKTQDGRTSKAMFDLIESMRQLRHAGQRVGILAFERNENLDVPTTPEELTFLSPEDNVIQSRGNDRTMADNIVYAAVLYRKYTVVVLSGHTYTTIGYPADKDFQPMGYIVAQQLPVFFIGFQTEGGTHWQTGPGGGRERSLSAGRLSEGSQSGCHREPGSDHDLGAGRACTETTMITLYGFGRIFPEGRGETKDLWAQWALEEVGLPYRVHALDHTGGELDGEAYGRISPFHQAPLIDDGGFVVAESAAIALYLAKKAGKLIPADEQGRTRVMQWCFAAVATVGATFVSLDLIGMFDAGKAAPKLHDEVGKIAGRWLADVERRLEGREWLACAEFTVADLMMACVLRMQRQSGVIDPYPRVKDFYARCFARPAWERTLAMYAERVGVSVEAIR